VSKRNVGFRAEPKLNALRPSFWHLYTCHSIRCISRPVVAHLTSENSARFGPEAHISTQFNLRDMVCSLCCLKWRVSRIIPFLEEGTPMKARSIPIGLKSAALSGRGCVRGADDPNVEDTYRPRIGVPHSGRQGHRRNDSVVAFAESQARATP